MKCILNFANDIGYKWANEYFPSTRPDLLPVIGKPILEYFIDFCAISKIKEILWIISDDSHLNGVEKYANNINLWGADISIVKVSEKMGVQEIQKEYSEFIENEPTLYIDKIFFPLYDKNVKESEYCFPESIKYVEVLNDDKKESMLSKIDPIYVDDIKEYYLLNISLLNTVTPYLYMLGYASPEKEYVGMNVSIHPQCILDKPIYIGDNVKFFGNASADNSIICSDCIIDGGTNISSSIILDGSYVGGSLYLNKKIVYHDSVIDPMTGIKIHIEDDSILSHVNSNILHDIFSSFTDKFMAFILIIFQTIPYLFFITFFKISYEMKRYTKSKSGESIFLRTYGKPKSHIQVIFKKFSLNRYVWFWRVLLGDVRLVGDKMYIIPEGKNFSDISELSRYHKYNGGIFCYSDYLSETSPKEILLDDIYYNSHESLLLKTKIVLMVLINNLFGNFDFDG